MYKYYSYLRFIFLLFLVGACQDETNTFGKNLVDSVFRNLVTDTCTVTLTAIQIDSLDTSGKGVILVGKYRHPLWGTTRASSYLSFTRPNYGTNIEEVVVFDSLVLNMAYNTHFIGDTTQWQKLDVHRLTEKVELNDNGYLYNTSSVTYGPEEIGSITFKPKPHTSDRLNIRMPDNLGRDLLQRFHTRDERVSGNQFAEYFKGIVIRPDENLSQSFLSFQLSDTMTNITLHYHIQNDKENEQLLTFIPDSENQFNRVIQDRTGTILSSFPSFGAEIPSASLGNRSFLSCLTGWYTRMEFPYLNNLLKQGERVEIESARLLLYPEYGTYSDYNPLPDSVYLYIADENNVVTDAIKDYLGTAVQGGKLIQDGVYYENTYYYFDVTAFMQEELGAFGMNKHNLQLVFPSTDFTSKLNNLTFGDQESRYPVKLQITYKIYESY